MTWSCVCDLLISKRECCGEKDIAESVVYFGFFAKIKLPKQKKIPNIAAWDLIYY